jgi:hypothetical protein
MTDRSKTFLGVSHDDWVLNATGVGLAGLWVWGAWWVSGVMGGVDERYATAASVMYWIVAVVGFLFIAVTFFHEVIQATILTGVILFVASIAINMAGGEAWSWDFYKIATLAGLWGIWQLSRRLAAMHQTMVTTHNMLASRLPERPVQVPTLQQAMDLKIPSHVLDSIR